MNIKMAEKDNMKPYLGYIEEVEFESLVEQCRDKQAEQAATDNYQSDKLIELEEMVSDNKSVDEEQSENDKLHAEKLAELEARIAVLEEKVAVSETKELVNQIDNMKDGDELSLAFPADVILKEKSLSVKANTIVTIDLNDKSIKAETPNVDAVLIEDGATLTINGNGVVEAANGGNGYPIIANGKLIINGGEFKSGYDADNKANACVYARGNGDIEIHGGRFQTFDGTFVLNKKDADRATTSIKVYGGEFVNFDPSNNKSEIPQENFVADGYKVESYTEGENTIYKVVKE